MATEVNTDIYKPGAVGTTRDPFAMLMQMLMFKNMLMAQGAPQPSELLLGGMDRATATARPPGGFAPPQQMAQAPPSSDPTMGVHPRQIQNPDSFPEPSQGWWNGTQALGQFMQPRNQSYSRWGDTPGASPGWYDAASAWNGWGYR